MRELTRLLNKLEASKTEVGEQDRRRGQPSWRTRSTVSLTRGMAATLKSWCPPRHELVGPALGRARLTVALGQLVGTQAGVVQPSPATGVARFQPPSVEWLEELLADHTVRAEPGVGQLLKGRSWAIPCSGSPNLES